MQYKGRIFYTFTDSIEDLKTAYETYALQK
jgi:hypothetical protein